MPIKKVLMLACALGMLVAGAAATLQATTPPQAQPQPQQQTTMQPPSITAWLHKNDWRSAVDSVRTHASEINEASPAWYAPKPDGTVAPLAGASVDDPALLAAVHAENISLQPLIMNAPSSTFDPSLVTGIIADPTRTDHHVAAIATLVAQHHYSGITIDYENLPSSSLNAYARFIASLAGTLHAEGKMLGVTVQPKAIQPNNEDNALAWRRIAASADILYLMAYPEHNAATDPGPIASLDWVRTQLQKALAVIPASKLSLGLATYAIAWDGGKAKSGSYVAIVSPAITKGAGVSRDAATGTPRLTSGPTWYEDAQSIREKIILAESMGVTHFGLWRLGGEDPDIWKVIAGN